MDEKEQHFGTYVVIPCKHNASPNEKVDVINKGIKRIFDKMKVWDIIPDFDTMQFIIHEGEHSRKSLDWYCEEKGKQIDDIQEVITVGVKFIGKLRTI